MVTKERNLIKDGFRVESWNTKGGFELRWKQNVFLSLYLDLDKF